MAGRAHVGIGVLFVGLLIGACAKGTATFEGDNEDGGAGGSGGGMEELPCDVDCSLIAAPECHVTVCNENTKQCVVVNDDGAACDDGQFCSTEDACEAGSCHGGGANPCDENEAAPCYQYQCNEMTDSCEQTAQANGTPCTTADLCIIGSSCSNGFCAGGQYNTCAGTPVPSVCDHALCNSGTGDCEVQPNPGANGSSCVNPDDLCSDGNTCLNGDCQGGGPKDCSQLDAGCVVGVCDTGTGNCVTQNLMNGDPCNDVDACTTNTTCTNGTCGGGTVITSCINGDSCCPSSCDETNDDDCGCGVNHALIATGSASSGGSFPYGPENYNNGVDEVGCNALACSGCQGWVSNDTMTNGQWFMYEWSSPVIIGSMFVDANNCPGSTCYSGRTMGSGDIEYWNGAAWVFATSFSNNDGDLALTFMPKINTTKLRIMNVKASNCGGQTSNTLIYEWYVWSGSGCMP